MTVKEAPTNPRNTLVNLVRQHLQVGGELPKLSVETIEGIYTYAYQFYEHGKYSEAISFFRFLTLTETQNKKYWIGLAASLQMLKNYDEAIHAYSVAAVIDENDPYVHIYAADCFFALKQVEKGLEAISSAEKVAAQHKKFNHLLSELDVIRSAWEKEKAHA